MRQFEVRLVANSKNSLSSCAGLVGKARHVHSVVSNTLRELVLRLHARMSQLAKGKDRKCSRM